MPVAEQPFTLQTPGSSSQSLGTRHGTQFPPLHTFEPLHVLPSSAFAGAHAPAAEQPFTLQTPGSASQSLGTRHATQFPPLQTSEVLHVLPSSAFTGAQVFVAEQPLTLQTPGAASQSDGDKHPTQLPSLQTPALHSLPFITFCGWHVPVAKLQWRDLHVPGSPQSASAAHATHWPDPTHCVVAPLQAARVVACPCALHVTTVSPSHVFLPGVHTSHSPAWLSHKPAIHGFTSSSAV